MYLQSLSFFCLSQHFSPLPLYNAAVPPHDFWLSPPRAYATHVLEHTKHYIFVAQVTNLLKATVRAPLFLLLCCCRRPTLRPSPPTPTLYKFSTIHSPPLLLFFCITVSRTDSGNRTKTEIAEPVSPLPLPLFCAMAVFRAVAWSTRKLLLVAWQLVLNILPVHFQHGMDLFLSPCVLTHVYRYTYSVILYCITTLIPTLPHYRHCISPFCGLSAAVAEPL